MKRFLPILLLLASLATTALAQPPAPKTRALAEAGRPVLSHGPIAPSVPNRTTHSFQISLLLADVEGDGSYQGLSKNAQKALEDLQDFLPFRSYRLLDFAWLRTSMRSSARVKGPDGRTFKLSLHLGGWGSGDDGKIHVSNFDLRETSGVDLDVEAGPLMAPQELISTSFSMDEGETVVVGTSRLDGDQRALVVLLTAVPTSLGGS